MATPVPVDDLPSPATKPPVPETDLPSVAENKPDGAAKAKKVDKPSAFRDLVGQIGPSVGKFGLMGVPIAGISQGAKTLEELMTKGAYTAGGAVTDVGSKMGLPPELSAGAGFATNVGLQAIPMVVGGEAAKAVSPAMQSYGKRLMQSALKPTLEAQRTGKSAKAVDTLLQEGINVTPGGVDTLQSKITGLNQKIAQAIQASPATVDKGQVASILKQALDKFEKQVTPQSDIKAIQNAWDNFINHPLLVGKQDIPVQLAQELKQGTYRSLGDKSYGELKGADIEAQKTLARGLKEEIVKAVPQVRELNAEESKLLNALTITERRVLMDANKNPVGLGWLSLHPGHMAGWLADRSPLFKSLVARMLYSGSEQLPATAARVGIGGIEAGTQNRQRDRGPFRDMVQSTGAQP